MADALDPAEAVSPERFFADSPSVPESAVAKLDEFLAAQLRPDGALARPIAVVTSGGTNGSVITETASAGTNVAVVGQALESAVSGDRVACTIDPFIRQGG